MFTTGMAMTLRPGGYDEYKKAHDELWPEIAESMASNNVSMMIYKLGERLVLFATAPAEADWEKSREAPILKDWHDYMAKLLETDDEGNITFDMLPEAFSFGMFKA